MGTIPIILHAEKYESMYHDYSLYRTNKPQFLWQWQHFQYNQRCLIGTLCAWITYYIFELVTFNFRILTEHEISQMLTNYYDST